MGCGNRVDTCPAKKKALLMKPLATQTEMQARNRKFFTELSIIDDVVPARSVKGSQFRRYLYGFSGGSCGCGETVI